jgi:hypothetical protein
MTSTILTASFWEATTERAAKSALQGAVTAGIGAAGFNAIHADWQTIGGAALSMMVLSVVTSLLSGLGGDGPSLTNVETLAAPAEEPTPEPMPEPVPDFASMTRQQLADYIGIPAGKTKRADLLTAAEAKAKGV